MSLANPLAALLLIPLLVFIFAVPALAAPYTSSFREKLAGSTSGPALLKCVEDRTRSQGDLYFCWSRLASPRVAPLSNADKERLRGLSTHYLKSHAVPGSDRAMQFAVVSALHRWEMLEDGQNSFMHPELNDSLFQADRRLERAMLERKWAGQ